MAIKNHPFFVFLFVFYTFMSFSPETAHAGSYLSTITGGNWVVLQESIGISAMHMQVLRNNKVIMFDRTDFGRSNLSLPDGKCRFNDEIVKPKDCTAHSVLYDIASNTFRPLMVQTDTWCSSGSLDSSGNLVQTGGYRAGEALIRSFTPCDDDSCDWAEVTNQVLWNRRWYASNQLLPDGRIIIVGGRRAFTYEFYPKNPQERDNFTLPFLMHTRDRQEEINLYPFLHLLPDAGITNVTDLPEAEVMICGGAQKGAYIKSNYLHIYEQASRTCGRLKVTDPKPEWVMELMPIPRIMNDMVLLPTGDLLIINGATNGSAGWNDAMNPVHNPVLYQPDEDPTRRFTVLSPSKIGRLYHSTAALLPDGRILVGGSNPHQGYNITGKPYPTELSLEAFYLHYLDPQNTNLRPSILTVELSGRAVSYGEIFSVTFVCSSYRLDLGVSVTVIAPSFTTHSFGMNQRMVVLIVVSVVQLSMFAYKANVIGPINVNMAPPGYYMLFVVHAGIPSNAVWVNVR
ncbi:hypothetical protein OIU77_014750 [Salix suchowensis]|uniref:Galactose oxidase n=1 Tax=Salix suchowensis TaxID=1278906 RepID=A0ABQ8ZYA1_9ROSI|nr:hypothetical protein OIU77_014750 [Salix suchowensis]